MMKTLIQHKVTRTVRHSAVLVLLGFVLILPSCFNSDDVGGNYYTFTGQMMGEYLKADPNKYSEFTKMLDTTGAMGLLNAYGQYTCFAPTNEALYKFYAKKGRTSIYQFPIDTIKKMVYDHLISGVVYSSSDFRYGRIPKVTMSDRFLSTRPTVDAHGLPVIIINETSPIVEKDIKVHNGIIQAISEVIDPTNWKLKEVIEHNDRYKIFYSALMATGLYKEIELIEDKNFVPLAGFKDQHLTGTWTNAWDKTPRKRLYGYTALIESDSTYNANGINNLDDLKTYAKQMYDQVYPQDAAITDIEDRKNSLNRFVAYHLINKQLGYTKFIYDLDNTGILQPNKSHSTKVADMFDYIETMCPNTLIEVRTLRLTNEVYGVFNMLDLTGEKAIRIVKDHKDIDARNGVYHEIDKILAYTKEFVSVLSIKRLRFDAASFFPEFTNNNMRCSGASVHWRIPKGFLERMSFSEGTQINYLTPDDRFCDFQGDELFSSVPGGVFEVKMITPPVPKGTYEVRFGFLNNGKRGIVQLFFDGLPCGIPVNLSIKAASDPLVGWVKPGNDNTDPDGRENDKMMHNRGWMKGPEGVRPIDVSENWQPDATARSNPAYLRRVLGVYTFTEDGTHVLGCKAAEVGEFMLDFIEFVPSEAIEQEDIY